jgi:4-hydroxy-tetrahydrodipicolinate reductase
MGKRILCLAAESGDFEISAALEHSQCPVLGSDAGEIAGIGRLNIPLTTDKPKDADVMIDFTLAPAADETMDYCLANNVALVMGTTGLSDEQLRRIDQVSEKIPVIQATNMSVGMNVLFEMAGKFAAMLGEEYDIEIVEHHHRFKKDSPSGSALTLAENVCRGAGLDYPDAIIHGRAGSDTLRQKGEIGMHAVRGGDIIGYHEVIYSTLGETVRVTHNAHNRDNFVRGALRGALWLAGKKPGRYQMKDVLGL